jgi:shikimate dehydrogenase
MKINGKTKIVTLIGYPVEHTLSPDMHNSAFEHLGLDYCYIALPVKPEMLKEAVSGLRALNFAGANVTVPHKENVLQFLDEINGDASFIGAVNTIVNRDGSLVGFNTDGWGFMRSLSEEGIDAGGKIVFLVGSGGAARAISYHLSEETSRLFLYDIDTDKSEKLASDLGNIRSNVSRADPIEGLASADVIINATPMGLHASDPLPFDTTQLSQRQVIIDLVYRETRLQEEATQKGLKTINGLGMLLWQGVLAFELWTGVIPPHDLMRKALVEGLG